MTDTWISYLASTNPTALFYPLDIRRSISSQFQILAAFCQVSYESVSDTLSSLNTSKLITPKMLSYSAFLAEVQTIVTSYQTNLLDEQSRTNILIRSSNELNQLPNALSTNYIYTGAVGQRGSFYFLW